MLFSGNVKEMENTMLVMEYQSLCFQFAISCTRNDYKTSDETQKQISEYFEEIMRRLKSYKKNT